MRLSSALSTILATSLTWNFALSIQAIAKPNTEEGINKSEKPLDSPTPRLIKQPKTNPLLASIRELQVDQRSTVRENLLSQAKPVEIAQEPDGATEETSPTTPSNQAESRVLVAEVDVTGVDERLTEIVYETIDTKPGRTTTRAQLQEDINAIYAVGFFQNVEVIPEDTPLGVKITFAVVANPILNEVTIQTVPPDVSKQVLPPETVEEIFSPGYGELLNLRDLQEGIKKVNEWYSANGYELAQVVGSPEVNEDGTVVLVVAEGVIENIEISFLDEEDEPTEGKTRDFIITREIELQPGDVFNRNTAQRDLQRVFGL